MTEAKKTSAADRPLILFLYLNLIVPVTFIAGGIILLSTKDSLTGFGILMAVIALLLIAAFVGFVCVLIHTIRVSIRLYRENDLKTLYQRARNTKLILIPFYLINFALSAVIFLVLMTISRGMILFFLPVPFMITYGYLLCTSVASTALLLGMKKQGTLDGQTYLIHQILQLIFVLDIVDILLLKKHVDQTEKNVVIQ